ncbi:MAG: type 1 glutamine amidotransferase [Thiotrichaceae bacterium]|nr:type 1 glutamine amidotransferase [Thiotrichaceae bacterium]
MKQIGITQRVENIQSYSERRDCLDQRWSSFVFELGYIPVPLPNIAADKVTRLLDALSLDAILLSGGNSITSLDPSASDIAPERDEFELALLSEALARNIPLIGICRGMQVINTNLGGKLTPVNGHVTVHHMISMVNSSYQLPELVNSYHKWGIRADSLAEELDIIAVDSDGNIEAFEHKKKKLLGIMWHPEREKPFNRLDIQLIQRFLL